MIPKVNATVAGLTSRDRVKPIIAPQSEGPSGDDGWTPVLAGDLDGTRTLIRVMDWTGGEGPKPGTGMYLGTTGYVATKAQAFNFNVAKRVFSASAVTNAQGVATINFGQTFEAPPQVVALPASTPALSGPTRSAVTDITTTGCRVTVQQQAVLTGLLSFLVGATANVLVVER